MNRHLDVMEYEYALEGGDVSTVAVMFDAFSRDHKFKRYPHMGDNWLFKLTRSLSDLGFVEYTVDYSTHSRFVADSELLRATFRF